MGRPIERRTVIKGAAWSMPVIAAAVAVPASSASTSTAAMPQTCTKLPNHGHGGDVGNSWWQVTYSDDTERLLDNGTVMRDRELRELCR